MSGDRLTICPVCGDLPSLRVSKDRFLATRETAYQYYCCGITSSVEKDQCDAKYSWNAVVADLITHPTPPISKTITVGKFIYPREEDNEQRDADD
jgi:hypothetical protein